jgi:arylesterase/paraoxonase
VRLDAVLRVCTVVERLIAGCDQTSPQGPLASLSSPLLLTAMPSVLRILSFTVIPASGLLVALLVPKLEFAGVFRTAENQNNEQCVALPGLEACEDAFVHDATGTAYLVCSDIKTRQQWLPAMLHLDATALPDTSTDYIALYSFNTNDHSRLALTGQPAGHTGIYVHAIDIFQTPNTDVLTLFINSHRPPTDRSKGTEGANSVVEMYETTVGSTEAKYVGEVEDLKLRTPNNLVAMSERTFYASNDHLRKNHWVSISSIRWKSV